MIHLILFGPPGTGKGTQAELLKEHYGLVHLSTGVMFRENKEKGTTLGLKAKEYEEKGQLVPDSLTITMLEAEVQKHRNVKGFIFDGYPRTLSQAQALDSFLAQRNETIDAVLSLLVNEDLLVERLLNRGKTSNRADDQDEERIRTRFKEYVDKTSPLAAYYRRQGKYYEVNGVGDVPIITKRLIDIIERL